MLSYRFSENGIRLPEGYSGQPLSDEYDMKLLMMIHETADLRPDTELLVLPLDETEKRYNMLKAQAENAREQRRRNRKLTSTA